MRKKVTAPLPHSCVYCPAPFRTPQGAEIHCKPVQKDKRPSLFPAFRQPDVCHLDQEFSVHFELSSLSISSSTLALLAVWSLFEAQSFIFATSQLLRKCL
jgi:hypothetical protein